MSPPVDLLAAMQGGARGLVPVSASFVLIRGGPVSSIVHGFTFFLVDPYSITRLGLPACYGA